MNALAVATPAPLETEFDSALLGLHHWLQARDYAGYEPYDVLNSPFLGTWAQHQPFATLLIQSAKRIGGLPLRRLLQIPHSRNPKALGLALAAYCDLSQTGWDSHAAAEHVKHLLIEARSNRESDSCWGYDWHYVSLRGARLPAFSPNSIATVFCADALLDYAEAFNDREARAIALSAAHWLATRLQRSVDDGHRICLSYTPHDRTRIFNNSALVGALLARVGRQPQNRQYRETAHCIMQYLADGQSPDGSWRYGMAPSQSWIDSFHTGYNLCALLAYQKSTGDQAFGEILDRGYDFYRRHFFRGDGSPRYFHDRTYPIDIHACSQAILTFCAFSHFDSLALSCAEQVARWTIAHLRNRDGSFGYQIHRFHTDRTPYVRWSEAWMLRALARLRLHLCGATA